MNPAQAGAPSTGRPSRSGSAPALRRRGSLSLTLLVGTLCLAGLATIGMGVAAILSKPGEHALVGSGEMQTLLDIGRALRADIVRVIQPTMDRTQALARNGEVIDAIRRGPEAAEEACNRAVTGATEIDAIALFDADGRILAINTVYTSGLPVEDERVRRVLRTDFEERDIIRSCVRSEINSPILEFQTRCDITPALFDSSGLSVAYSVPVIDPLTGEDVGVVSSRLRFERLTELTRQRTIASRTDAVEFVTDLGDYFSEEIAAGRAMPPVPRDVLAGIVAPLVRGGSDVSITQYEDDVIALFRLDSVSTLSGGGIQVMIRASREWLGEEAHLTSVAHGIGRIAAGLVLIAIALLLRAVFLLRRTSRDALRAKAATDAALAEIATYRAALDEHLILLITDVEGRIIHANDAYCRLTGRRRIDLIGNSHRDLDHLCLDDRAWKRIACALRRGEIWHGELCSSGHAGRTEIWVEATIVPFRARGGGIGGYIAICTDITARRSAERRVAAERAQLAAFVEHAPAAIAMLDRELRYVAVSDRWATDFGLEGQELTGRRHVDTVTDLPAHWRDAYARGLAGEIVRQETDVWQPAEGESLQHLRWEVRPWYIAADQADETREIGGIMIFAEDLTSTVSLQAQAEETSQRLEMALDAGGLGSWDWNVVSGYVRFDDRFAAQLGLRADELRPHADEWLARVHPDDRDAAQQAVRDHLEGRTPFYENEHRVRHADGGWRWVLDRGRVVQWDANGRALRMVGTHTDVTERKAAEARLAHTQKLESIGQLAAGIAHEINTPAQYVGDNIRFLLDNFGHLLHALDRYRQLLLPGSTPRPWHDRASEMETLERDLDLAFLVDEIPGAVEQSIEGIDRISSIIKAMKDFSHPGSDAKELADINAAIESTVTVCRNRWKYVADLELDLDPALPRVPVLLNELNQVILNLVVNAADAIADRVGSGGRMKGLIRVATRVEGDAVRIDVRDDGGGIPERDRHRVFEPFFTTKGVGRGTGQGLAICHTTITRKHGGRITFVTSSEGTTFTVLIPLDDRSALGGAGAGQGESHEATDSSHQQEGEGNAMQLPHGGQASDRAA